MPTTRDAGERRALVESALLALLMGAAAIAWGLLAGSRVILFDGGYLVAGVGLSWWSVRTVEVVARGASARYPFGRESLRPLVVLVQGVALLAILVYAAADAVLVIRGGGSETAAASVAAYGLVSALGGWLVARRVRSLCPDSALVDAEMAQWRSGVALSAVMAVGGGLGIALQSRVGAEVLRYLDPTLLLLACAVLVAVPVRLAASAVRELLETAPPADIADDVRDAVQVLCAEQGLSDPSVRTTLIGRRLDVDIDVLVPAGSWDVARIDAARHRLHDLLEPLGLDLWVALHPTHDPTLLKPT